MEKIKYLLLLLVAIFSLSCSSDDSNVIIDHNTETGDNDPDNGDDDPDAPDPIIGTWTLIGEGTINAETGEETERTLSDCRKLSTLEFREDNTFVSEFFEEDELGCNSVLGGPVIVPWENNGDGTYTFTDENGDLITAFLTFEGNTVIAEERDEDARFLFKDTYRRVQ